MDYRGLGRSGIKVSRYGLGTMMFGAWGNTDHAACERMLNRALDSGINFVDTADMYAAGETETIVGRALGKRRDDVVLATKFHHPVGEHSDPLRQGNSRRWIVKALDDSLRRLGTDHVDLYQVHRPDPATDLSETVDCLSELVRAGKIRAWGTSTFPAHEIVSACWSAERNGGVAPTSEQPPYSILCRGIEADVLGVSRDHAIGVVTWSPLSGGWLTGKYTRSNPTPAGSRGATNPDHFDLVNDQKFAAVEQLEAIAKEAGVSLTHLALAWNGSHPAISSTLLGPRTEEQLEDLLQVIGLDLDESVLDAIDAVVPPGTNLNAADAGWTPPYLDRTARRR